MLIFAGNGTAATGYFPYQYEDNSTDGLYLIPQTELDILQNGEAIVSNIAVQFQSASATLAPANFKL